MNFMNIGPWELMVILALAILVMGPRRALEITRTFGRISAQMRRLSGQFLGTLQTEMRDAEREVRQAAQDASEDGARILEEVEQIEQGADRSMEGETVAGGEDTLTGVRSLERETRGVMQEIVHGIRNVVRGGEADVEGRGPEDG